VEHQEITLDPKIFDRYVGSYQFDASTLLTLSRDGSHFYLQLTGQPKIDIFAESDRKFFLKAVDAQVSMDVDAQGAATRATLHQNGRNTPAARLNEADAKKALADVEARTAEIAARFKAQKQSPGTEAALRRTIQELQSGEPKYELMTDAFAAVTRQQLPQLKGIVNGFGALQSVTFKGVGPAGADIYEVQFEKAKAEFRLSLTQDGKTAGVNFRPL
jgi:hypothetical protein